MTQQQRQLIYPGGPMLVFLDGCEQIKTQL
jgi:hypothetical protein